MNVWLKRVMFGLVILVIAVMVGLAIFLLTFNPNAYKNKLQELVYERYQRTLTIDGDIGLSLFPRIGLSVRDASLSNRGGKDTFISVDSARFAVAIWPLLSNQLVVDHVAVSGLKAWVTRDAKGHFNFNDLMASTAAPQVQTSASVAPPIVPAALASKAQGAELDIDIAGLELKDGQIHYLDQRSKLSTTISRIEASTGRVTYDQPFDVSIKGDLAGQAPALAAHFEAQVLLRLNPAVRGYAAQKINVQFTGRAGNLNNGVAALKGNLAYSGTERNFSAGNLELTLSGDVLGEQAISGLKATLSAPQIRLDQRNTELKISKLAVRASGKSSHGNVELAFDAPALAISPESAQGDPVTGTIKVSGEDKLALALKLEGFSGNANELQFQAISLDGGVTQGDRLTRLKLSSPAIWNLPLRKGSLSALKGDLGIRNAVSPEQTFEFPMIGSVHLDLVKDTLDADINAVIDGGQLAFKSHTQRLAQAQTQFSLAVDKLDLNRWLAPAAHPAPKAPPEGHVAADSGKAAAPPPAPSPAASAEAKIDLSFLKGQDITGTVKVDDLRVRDVQLRGLSAAVSLQKSRLQISKLAARLYEGTLSGDLSATADQAFAMQLALDKVSVEPFMRALTGQGYVSGTAAARVNLQAQGDTVSAILRALGGRVSWQVRDGAAHGINVSKSLEEASGIVRGLLQGQGGSLPNPFGPERRTAFSSFDGQIDFQGGKGKVSKLALVSDLVRVTEGKPASIDLAAQRVDLMLNTQITARPPKALAETIGPLRGATLPVLISGPFSQLAYDVQWKAVRNQAIKDAVKSGLMDLLSGEQLAPAASSGAESAPAASAAPAKAADPVKRIGDALKGLLGH